MADLPSETANAVQALRTPPKSPPVLSEYDHPGKNFREDKWLIPSQVLAILLFLLYFFRVTTNATTGGGGADRGFIAMLDPGNLLPELYNGFPWIMAWPPLASVLSISYSVLWVLLLEDIHSRYARNVKKTSGAMVPCIAAQHLMACGTSVLVACSLCRIFYLGRQFVCLRCWRHLDSYWSVRLLPNLDPVFCIGAGSQEASQESTPNTESRSHGF